MKNKVKDLSPALIAKRILVFCVGQFIMAIFFPFPAYVIPGIRGGIDIGGKLKIAQSHLFIPLLPIDKGSFII